MSKSPQLIRRLARGRMLTLLIAVGFVVVAVGIAVLTSRASADSPESAGSSVVGDNKAGAVSHEQIADEWDALLAKYVRDCEIDGIATSAIDYAAISNDAAFDALVANLAIATEPPDRDARLAFYINAYNILAVRTVTEAYPVESIRDIGSLLRSVWKREAGTVAGTARSLDDIEHGIVRKFGDARIHAAVNCASLSCPDLRPESFRPERLDEQLDDAMRRWLASPAKGAALSEDGKTLRVSSIFDWFGEDFTGDDTPMIDAIREWLPDELRDRVSADKTRIRYFDYDWSLNDTARCGG